METQQFDVISIGTLAVDYFAIVPEIPGPEQKVMVEKYNTHDLLVATGRAAVMIDAIVALWDVAAVQPVIEQAGGTLTDWRGNRSIYAGEAVATNGAVLDEVLAITRPFAR